MKWMGLAGMLKVASSTVEGTEHVVLGDYSFDVPLATADPLYPPGRLWRLTRVTF